MINVYVFFFTIDSIYKIFSETSFLILTVNKTPKNPQNNITTKNQ